MQVLLPFTIKRILRARGWGIGNWFLEQFLLFTGTVSFLIGTFLFLTKNQKKTACGLYYKYEVSMKSLYYILCFAEKTSCVSRKNYFEILCFAEKQMLLPFTIKRFVRVRDWGIGSCFFWNSFFFY